MDLFAALVIGAVGIDALRHVSHRRQLALALVPMTLAIHQFVEVGVWWSQEGLIPESVGTVAMYLYLAIALVVVPILIPLGVRNVETEPKRRRGMTPFLAGGVLIGIVLAAALVVGPVRASIGGHYIDYGVGTTYYPIIGALYIGAISVPLIMSSHRPFAWLGLFNLVLVGGLAYLLVAGLISLWCGAAALQSVVIAHYLRSEAGDPWRIPDRLRELRSQLRTG